MLGCFIQLANGRGLIEQDTHMRILNLTQHTATAEQIAAGVVESDKKSLVQMYLTFDELPSRRFLMQRAEKLAAMARHSGCEAAMIGGAPFFMAPLEAALAAQNITVLYAFSKRESVEEMQPDGSVKKTQVFRHAGFVEVPSGDSVASSFHLANRS
jgi:hypothetical protein